MAGMIRLVRKWHARLARDEQGSILIEAGVVIGALGLLSLLVWDVGSLFLRQMEITNAVRAGSQYALVKRPVGGNVAPVLDAVRNAAPEGTTPEVNAELYCLCDSGGPMMCSNSCSTGSEKRYFLTIEYSDGYEFLFNYPGISKNLTLGDSMRVRLK